MSIVEENWDYRIDEDILEIEKKSFAEFELICQRENEHVNDLLDSYFKRSIWNNIGNVQMNDGELDAITESNKVLRQNIEQQLDTIKRQQPQYEEYKKDQKLLSKEIKDTHEAFLMAKKYYKKYLKIYYTIESKTDNYQTIFIQFFTEAKKENENYSVRLNRFPALGTFELLSSSPKLEKLKDLQKELVETKDIANVLYLIRKAFLSIKNSKKL